jgi:uncharacterized membrane protein
MSLESKPAPGQSPNLSSKFRGLLKRELPLWISEGTITPDEAARITRQYRLEDLGRESSRLLVAVIFGIGGLLLGGGVLAFVAAHWETIPTAFKVALLFAALLGFYGSGWYLWRERDMERLGRSLVFTGCIVFGANIGLMAQIFHIRSEWYHGFLAWAVGSLAMAWAIRSPLVGLLALATSFTWYTGFFSTHQRLAQVYPPLVLLALVPLALWAGSRALFTLTAWTSVFALVLSTGDGAGSSQPVLLALVSSGFVLWTAGLEESPGKNWERFAPASRVSGMVALGVAAYLWSFLDFWDEPHHWNDMARVGWTVPVLASLLLGGWFFLRSLDAIRASGKPGFLTWGTLGAILLMALPGVAFLGGSEGMGGLGAASANLACLLLGSVAIGSGLAQERRAHFWLGTLFLVLVVLSRFMEYETGLLLKSLAFTSCGALVIYAGARYEGYLKLRGAARV